MTDEREAYRIGYQDANRDMGGFDPTKNPCEHVERRLDALEHAVEGLIEAAVRLGAAETERETDDARMQVSASIRALRQAQGR